MSKVSGWVVRHHGASFLCVSDEMMVEGMLSGAVYCGGGGAGAAPEEADGKGYKKVNLQPSPAEPSQAPHQGDAWRLPPILGSSSCRDTAQTFTKRLSC